MRDLEKRRRLSESHGSGPLPGFVRHYVDHTGRWYEDLTEEETAEREKDFEADPLAMALKEAIDEEIDKQIIDRLKEVNDAAEQRNPAGHKDEA